MKVFESIQEFQAWRRESGSNRIGFVPTMGALHVGHRALLERSVAEADHTVLSIYVNPTQFDNADDLNHYPNRLEQDLLLAQAAGVDVVVVAKAKVSAVRRLDELAAELMRVQKHAQQC